MFIRRIRTSLVSTLRALPLAQQAQARLGRVSHERRVRRFILAGDGRAGRLPLGVVYETTMRCNLRCEFCYVGELLNLEGEWRRELPLDALRTAFPDGTGLQVSLTGGEIFMRKDIMEVLDLFRQKSYRCGYLTTNGTIIDETRADALADLAASGFLTHVTVSIDGPGDLHDRARGVKGTFERTAAGLRRLQDAANGKRAPLRVSINTTVTHESLDALDQMVDVAEQLGVDAIGLNHLMFATEEEVEQTVRLTGAASSATIATFVTADPGIAPDEVRAKVSSLEEKCRQRNIRFDYRPKVKSAILDAYYTPGMPLAGRCFYPFLHARVGFSGKVFFCPFIRIEVGDLTESTLEEVWNSPRYVELRRRLLERQMFPVCRRCCKVELSPERLPAPAPAVTGRRVIRLTSVEGDGTPTPVGTATRETEC